MKKVISIVLIALFVVGCTQVIGPDGKVSSGFATPQQVISQICGPTQVALAVLNTPGAITTTDKGLVTDLMGITPVITAVCSAGATLDFSSLAKLATTGLPGILQILSVASISQAEKQVAIVGVAVAQAVLSQLLTQQNLQASSIITKDMEIPIGVLPGVKLALEKQ